MSTIDENDPLNNPNHGFGLPENYFQKSARSIMERLEWEEEVIKFPLLFKEKRPEGFLVPKDYFEKNEHRFEKMVHPVLDADPVKTGFELPNDYFKNAANRLQKDILKKAPEAKLIPLSRSFMSWTIAALLVVSIGIWMYSLVSPANDETDCNTIACIDRSEIVNSGHLEELDNEELYQVVNATSLENSIKDHIITGQDIRDMHEDNSIDDLIEDL